MYYTVLGTNYNTVKVHTVKYTTLVCYKLHTRSKISKFTEKNIIGNMTKLSSLLVT